MWWWHGGWGWAGWLLMVLGNLAFWWLLVWAVLALAALAAAPAISAFARERLRRSRQPAPTS